VLGVAKGVRNPFCGSPRLRRRSPPLDVVGLEIQPLSSASQLRSFFGGTFSSQKSDLWSVIHSKFAAVQVGAPFPCGGQECEQLELTGLDIGSVDVRYGCDEEAYVASLLRVLECCAHLRRLLDLPVLVFAAVRVSIVSTQRPVKWLEHDLEILDESTVEVDQPEKPVHL
jgi:hypothetical protein